MKGPIRIIGLSSSPQKQGNTETLVRTILQGAANQGAETKMIHLASYTIGFCQGCFHCMAHGTCMLHDDFTQIKKDMMDADGIVIGAPTYGLAPNALMKNVLDRLGMFSVYTSLLSDKYIIGVSTCGKFGAKKTAKQLTDIVDGIWGSGQKTAIITAQVGWKTVKDNPDVLKKAEHIGEKLVKDISKKKTYWYKGMGNKALSSLIMRPVMKQNIIRHKDDEMKGVYEYLKAKGLLH